MHNIDPNISIQLMKSTIWTLSTPFGQAASDVYTNNIYKKKSKTLQNDIIRSQTR